MYRQATMPYLVMLPPVNARRRFPGLGFTYNDVVSQAGFEKCSPLDFQCMARNQQRLNAITDLWAQYQFNPGTAGAPVPKISLTLVPDAQAMDVAPVEAGITVNGQVLSPPSAGPGVGFGVLAGQYGTNPSLNPSPETGVSMTPPPKPKVVVNSSGGQNAPATLVQAQTTPPVASDSSAALGPVAGSGVLQSSGAGFSLASLPWYAWAAGGVLLLLAIDKGGR